MLIVRNLGAKLLLSRETVPAHLSPFYFGGQISFTGRLLQAETLLFAAYRFPFFNLSYGLARGPAPTVRAGTGPALTETKKAWENLTFSPIPALRPSHCPHTRISNAASPRQAIIYTTYCFIHYLYIAAVGI